MSRFARFGFLPLTALLGICLLGPAAGAQAPGFRTPSGNIACDLYDGILRCDLLKNEAPIPPQPKDCELDWGNMFSMGVRGKPSRLCAGDTVFGNQAVLPYGKTWSQGGFHCTSAATGLTCRNRDKHGWMLNQRVQKFF
ncbi:MAG: DUF6636 domain-containing protein [Candidatus Sericytochromatia bacterium]